MNTYKYNAETNNCEMTIISKGKKYICLVDIDMFPELSLHRWSYDSGYIVSRMHNKKVYLHRHIKSSELSPNLQVDHINRNSLDNRITNLRVATNQENNFNKTSYKNSWSKFKGVSIRKGEKRKKKIFAQIMYMGKHYNLGYYATQEEAGRAYDKKAIELFGEYAELNFPISKDVV